MDVKPIRRAEDLAIGIRPGVPKSMAEYVAAMSRAERKVLFGNSTKAREFASAIDDPIRNRSAGR